MDGLNDLALVQSITNSQDGIIIDAVQQVVERHRRQWNLELRRELDKEGEKWETARKKFEDQLRACERDRTKLEDSKRVWEADRKEWEDSRRVWEADRKEWEDSRREWVADRQKLEDSRRESEVERQRLEDCRREWSAQRIKLEDQLRVQCKRIQDLERCSNPTERSIHVDVPPIGYSPQRGSPRSKPGGGSPCAPKIAKRKRSPPRVSAEVARFPPTPSVIELTSPSKIDEPISRALAKAGAAVFLGPPLQVSNDRSPQPKRTRSESTRCTADENRVPTAKEPIRYAVPKPKERGGPSQCRSNRQKPARKELSPCKPLLLSNQPSVASSALPDNSNLVTDVGSGQKIRDGSALPGNSNLVTDVGSGQKIRDGSALPGNSNLVTNVGSGQKIRDGSALPGNSNLATDVGSGQRIREKYTNPVTADVVSGQKVRDGFVVPRKYAKLADLSTAPTYLRRDSQMWICPRPRPEAPKVKGKPLRKAPNRKPEEKEPVGSGACVASGNQGNQAYEVIRGKARQKLAPVACIQCAKFNEATGATGADIACRHRFSAQPPPTPPHFWDLTAENM